MNSGQFSTVIIISSLIISSLALDVCEDRDTTKCQSCGDTDYPRDEFYRQNCMKSCGVCTSTGTNIALGKPTDQSSTYYDSTPMFYSYSNKAVDGNTSNSWENGYCTHTNSAGNEWWCVDLQQIFNIDNIKLFNRDKFKERLRGFEIKISSSGQCNGQGFSSATSCYKDTASTPQDVYTIERCNHASSTSTSISARTVYVTVSSQYLTLCEVQIFSDLAQCNTGYYITPSSTCQPCNTCLGDTCDPTNGVCTENCKIGFYGTRCQKNCNDDCLSSGCSKSDGRCNNCKPDTVGPYCNLTCGTECQPRTDQTTVTCDRTGRCTNCIIGKYGEGCDMSCNTGCDGGCERNIGKCTSCIGGKTGDGCNNSCNTNCTICKQDNFNSCTECKNGRWGPSCNKLCNTNCKSVVDTTVGKCDQMTGDCINGCVPGKIGSNCTTDCETGLYGDNCSSKCGNCADKTPCDITTGRCGLAGCADGYQGPVCKDRLPCCACTALSPVVYIVIGVLCGILSTVAVFLSYHFYKKRCQSNRPKEDTVPDYVYSNTDLNPTSSTTDATLTTGYQNIPTNTRNVDYVNQSFNTEDNTRNMYDTLDHRQDNTQHTYTTIDSSKTK